MLDNSVHLLTHAHELVMNRPFVLSYGSYSTRASIYVQLTDGVHTGLGEGSVIQYYGWDIDEMKALASTWPTQLDIAAIPALIQAAAHLPPMASALSCAYHDLRARQAGQTLSVYMGLVGPMPTQLPVTITGTTYEELEQQIDQFKWTSYKIKMGSDHDDMLAQIILDHPHKRFFIDANAGWKDRNLTGILSAISSPQVVFIEQPYPVELLGANKTLSELTGKPIIADESCQYPEDIARIAPYFDGVNIKLMKSGGWEKAMDIRRHAEAHGLNIMVGCMTETSIGISHGAQFARGAAWADLDGALLLKNDIATGARLVGGELILPATPGSGAMIKT